MDEPRPLFVKFLYFQAIYRTNTLGFSGIRTWIDGVEREHDDHVPQLGPLLLAGANF